MEENPKGFMAKWGKLFLWIIILLLSCLPLFFLDQKHWSPYWISIFVLLALGLFTYYWFNPKFRYWRMADQILGFWFFCRVGSKVLIYLKIPNSTLLVQFDDSLSGTFDLALAICFIVALILDYLTRNEFSIKQNLKELVSFRFTKLSSGDVSGNQSTIGANNGVATTNLGTEIHYHGPVVYEYHYETPPANDFTPPNRPNHNNTDLGGNDFLSVQLDAFESLIQELRWIEAEQLRNQLEVRLSNLPQRGSIIRRGWILLAKYESRIQLQNQREGRATDLSQLEKFEEMAQNVLD